MRPLRGYCTALVHPPLLSAPPLPPPSLPLLPSFSLFLSPDTQLRVGLSSTASHRPLAGFSFSDSKCLLDKSAGNATDSEIAIILIYLRRVRAAGPLTYDCNCDTPVTRESRVMGIITSATTLSPSIFSDTMRLLLSLSCSTANW